MCNWQQVREGMQAEVVDLGEVEVCRPGYVVYEGGEINTQTWGEGKTDELLMGKVKVFDLAMVDFVQTSSIHNHPT